MLLALNVGVKRSLMLALVVACWVLPLQCATLERLSLDDIITRSTSIVRGKVAESWAAFTGSVIYTHYKIQVSETFNGKTKNVEGLTYATQENSYLVGCLAGLMVKKQGGDQIIGVVGGVQIPPVDSFLAGYKAGAKACNSKIKILKGYSQDFLDQAKCKTVAQNQIDAGSQVEFNVAGPCGLGTLGAANDAGIWGIGVDVDQYALHPAHMLTSAVKRVDTGVYLAIKGAENGTFAGGKNLAFNLKNGGVAVGKVNPNVPAAFIKQINALRVKIVAGKIKPPAKLG